MKTWLGKAKTPLQSENAALSKAKKRFCRAKPSLAKAKMRLPSQNVSLLSPYVSGLPSEDIPRKGENAFTERKRSTKRRNRVYGAKISLAMAFTERKRGSLR